MRFRLFLLASLLIPVAAGEPARATVPSSGLVSRWLADGTANDAQGSNHGTLQNGAGYTTGVSGQAFNFDGVDDHVRIPEDASFFPGTGSFTVDAWIETAGTASRGSFVSYYECGGSCPLPMPFSAYIMTVLSSGVAEGIVRDQDSPTVALLTGNRPIANGVFHHVALSRDVVAGELKLFVDGVLDASLPVGTEADGSIGGGDGEADPLTFGAALEFDTGLPVDTYEGAVDDVKYFSRALTNLEILEIAREFLPSRFLATWADASPIQAIGGGLDPALLVGLSLEPVGATGPIVTTPDGETVVLTYSGLDPNAQLQINVGAYGLPFYPPDPVKLVGNQLQFAFDDGGTMATLTIDIASSSGAVVDPLSIVGFNPQPEPPDPGSFAYNPAPNGATNWMAGYVTLSGGTGLPGSAQISLSLQILDDALNPLPTGPVGPAAVPTLGLLAIVGLAGIAVLLGMRRSPTPTRVS